MIKRFLVLIALSLLIPTILLGAGIKVTWNPNTESDLKGYKVYFGTATGTYGTPVDVGNVTTYNILGLAEKTKYFVALTAYDTSNNESLKSTEVSITTPDLTPPSVPTNLKAVSGIKSLTLSWTAVADASGYKIYYGTAAGVYGAPVDAGNVTTFTLSNLLDDKIYYITISAYDSSANESAKCAEISAKTNDTTPPNPPSPPQLSIWQQIIAFLYKLIHGHA